MPEALRGSRGYQAINTPALVVRKKDENRLKFQLISNTQAKWKRRKANSSFLLLKVCESNNSSFNVVFECVDVWPG